MRSRVLIQNFHLEAALGQRIGLIDEWAVIGPLLPAKQWRGCRPTQDSRCYLRHDVDGAYGGVMPTPA